MLQLASFIWNLKVEPEFLNIIEYSGIKPKRIFDRYRYHLLLVKKDRKAFFSDNYLHYLSLKYSIIP